MSTDERLVRLENAFASLEELAARQFASLEELAARQDARTAEQDAHRADLEKHFKMLTTLALSADERLDHANERIDTTNERTNMLDSSISALTQIVAEVAVNQKHTDEQMRQIVLALAADRQLTDEQIKRTHEQLDRLAALVERYIGGGRVGNS